MKKRIYALCLCIVLLFSFSVASAAELAVTTEANGIEMSSLTYEGEELIPESDITITLTAKRLEVTEDDDKIILVASLLDNGVMTSMDTDSRELGTEATTFEATLTLPEDISGCEITVALLKQTENGLVPIGSSSYRPGKAEFLPVKSVTLASKELEFDEYNETRFILAPKVTEYPEDVTVETADIATRVEWELVTGEENYGLITASLPDGDSIEYRVNFENATHYLKLAQTDDEFTDENTWSDWNNVSGEVVMNAYTDYRPSNMPATYGDKKDDIGKDKGVVTFANYLGKVFTNLHGIDEEEPGKGGSRLFANYPANYRQRHAINAVDPLYEGCDYIITSNGAMTTDQSVIYYDFDLAYDAEVVILTLSKCNNYPQDGFTETTSNSGFAVGNYINLTYSTPLVDNFGISPLMEEVQAFQSAANGKSSTTDEYKAACDALAESLSERYGKEITGEQLADIKVGIAAATDTVGAAVGGTFAYKYAYTRAFTVADGEEAVNVKIKAPDTSQARGFIVVIKPIED